MLAPRSPASLWPHGAVASLFTGTMRLHARRHSDTIPGHPPPTKGRETPDGPRRGGDRHAVAVRRRHGAAAGAGYRHAARIHIAERQKEPAGKHAHLVSLAVVFAPKSTEVLSFCTRHNASASTRRTIKPRGRRGNIQCGFEIEST